MERLNIEKPVQITGADGTTVSARRLDGQPRPRPGSVAIHEAAHVVAAGEIVSATIVPSGDAAGATVPVRMTVEAAAAAAAYGCDGTGWDMFLVEHALGADRGSALAAGRAALSGKGDLLTEVATLLEERKTIGQGDVNEAHNNLERESQGKHPVEVVITFPNSHRETQITESFLGEVRIGDLLLYNPDQEADIPTAA